LENPTIYKLGNWKLNHSPTIYKLKTQPQPNNLQIGNPTLTPTIYELETPTLMNWKSTQ
jgi:hypothetical protein